MQKIFISYTSAEKNKTFHHRPSHSEDIPSACCTSSYILFPYKLLSSTIPKIINTCAPASCFQTDQQRHTISQHNLPKINMFNFVYMPKDNDAVVYNSLLLEIRTEATYHDFCKKLKIYLNS